MYPHFYSPSSHSAYQDKLKPKGLCHSDTWYRCFFRLLWCLAFFRHSSLRKDSGKLKLSNTVWGVIVVLLCFTDDALFRENVHDILWCKLTNPCLRLCSSQFHVFELTRQLPRFSMYSLCVEMPPQPRSSVTLQLNDRPQRVGNSLATVHL